MALHKAVKRLTAWLLCLLTALHICPALGESTPLLYRVTDENQHTLYLFGTVHAGHESMYPLPDAVMAAFAESDLLAVEVDLIAPEEDAAILQPYADWAYCNAGESSRDVLGRKLFNQCARVLGVQKRALRGIRVQAIVSMLENKVVDAAQFSAAYGIDRHLLLQARERGKAIIQLESFEEQYRWMYAISDEMAAWMVKSYVSDLQGAAEATRALTDAWRLGDEEKLCMLLAEDENAWPHAIADEMRAYQKQMYDERDARFARQAAAFLKGNETVFMAVGAGHVSGKNGIVQRLIDFGYTVEKIGH